MAWGVAPFCYFRYLASPKAPTVGSAGPKIHYLKDIKTISAGPLRSLRLCVRIVMPHGWAKPISAISAISAGNKNLFFCLIPFFSVLLQAIWKVNEKNWI